MPIRVFLADCQFLYSGCVHLALNQEGYQVVGEISGKNLTTDVIQKASPDAIILNASRNETALAGQVRRMKQTLSPLAVVVVGEKRSDAEDLFAALKSGANAYVPEDIVPSKLNDVIKKVTQGEYPITEGILVPSVAARILREFESASRTNIMSDIAPVALSPFERLILGYIANGSQLEEIVEILNVTEDIIRQRLYIILGKLVANHRNNHTQ